MEQLPPEHRYCGYCGAPFSPAGNPARQIISSLYCAACGHTTYLNPLTVGLVLLPVDAGVLVIRRKDTGRLAFPGGYLERGESWQAGMLRELYEETGVRMNAQQVKLYDARSTPSGSLLLLFGLLPPCSWASLPPFVPNTETTEMKVLTAPEPLAFPLHTEVLMRFFGEKNANSPNISA